jgi:DNA polymerase III subunit delta'
MNIYSWHQDQFKQLAQQAGRLPHALLLSGAVGIGKRVFARALAQGLLCEKPASALMACNTCEACHWFETDNHPDIRLLQPEAAEPDDEAEAADRKKKRDISIAQVRSLAEFVNISSHRDGVKVVLIQPAEAMNVNAANALLKSLEEPPPHTHFLLVADRPSMLPATIRSRCQQLALRPPTAKEAAQWLASSGSAQAELALAQAGGAPIRALELDTPEYWTSRRQFLEGLTSRSFDALALAERTAEQPVPQFIAWLQRWTYDLASVSVTRRPRYNPDFADALIAAAGRSNDLDVLRYHRELVQFQRVVNHPLNPRLLLEDLLSRYGQLIHHQDAHRLALPSGLS